ncbi:GspH/FimT family pseudopilin [Marinicella rhabdoformis]|uniref:GspH/FimT family pseudopilin n=1 Tax=Marinicella rhabdoformis TaxID=2580566 RepID=UPI0012AEB558|nr:GspH/FimT family pseudopilin [Marinicella rhabdoformis]
MKSKVHTRESQAKGFTLLEMVVVLILITILVAWGVPNFQQLKARRMVTDFSNEVLYSFTQARAEAIRYGTDVEVRPNGGSWQNGWTTIAIGVDGAANTTIAVQQAVDNRLIFVANGLVTGTMVFNSIGALEDGIDRPFRLTHDFNASISNIINVSPSGSARVTKL